MTFNTRPKIEEQILIVMNKSAHEEHLSQPLQTNNKQFKVAVTFLSAHNGNFDVKKKQRISFISRKHLLKKNSYE